MEEINERPILLADEIGAIFWTLYTRESSNEIYL